MTYPYSSDDRPDPADRQPAVRARVPDHVHRGVFSTGAIVMTGPNEFVIDFVQNLGRPFQVVARVILPHGVMPQFVDALGKNIDLFRQRYGPLPTVNNRADQIVVGNGPLPPPSPAAPTTSGENPAPLSPVPLAHGASGTQGIGGAGNAVPGSSAPAGAANAGAGNTGTPPPIPGTFSIDTNGGSSVTPLQPPVQQPRRLSPQEIYDELKLRDDVLSGSYANAVMIGHGPYEFSFDFITNFYPQSAVSARVFVASGQVGLFYDSIKSTWDQFRQRMQGPNPPDSPEPPMNPNGDTL